MIETVLLMLKAVAVFLTILSFFKFISKHKTPDISELEFFSAVDIKKYLTKTVTAERAEKTLKIDQKEFERKKSESLAKNVEIGLILAKNLK